MAGSSFVRQSDHSADRDLRAALIASAVVGAVVAADPRPLVETFSVLMGPVAGAAAADGLVRSFWLLWFVLLVATLRRLARPAF